MPPDGPPRAQRHLGFHLLTVIAVLVCLAAARWQWDRAHRTEADAVPDTPVVALDDLDPTTTHGGMRVRLDGTFDPDHELLVAPRDREGSPGAWVLTSFLPCTGDPTAVAVVRGWVPEGSEPADPPTGEVSVVGILVADTRQPGATPTGDPPTMDVVDTGALSGLAGYPVRSGWFALRELTPAAAGQPVPLLVTELPGADVGLNWRNASYALQWIAFAGFVLFFWVRFRRDLVRPEQESLR